MSKNSQVKKNILLSTAAVIAVVQVGGYFIYCKFYPEEIYSLQDGLRSIQTIAVNQNVQTFALNTREEGNTIVPTSKEVEEKHKNPLLEGLKEKPSQNKDFAMHGNGNKVVIVSRKNDKMRVVVETDPDQKNQGRLIIRDEGMQDYTLLLQFDKANYIMNLGDRKVSAILPTGEMKVSVLKNPTKTLQKKK